MDGVFDHDGDVMTLNGLCNVLYIKGVHGGACTDPNGIHPCVDGCFHMLLARHLNHEGHASSFSHVNQPLQCNLPHAVKAPRSCAGLPNPSTVNGCVTRFA